MRRRDYSHDENDKNGFTFYQRYGSAELPDVASLKSSNQFVRGPNSTSNNHANTHLTPGNPPVYSTNSSGYVNDALEEYFDSDGRVMARFENDQMWDAVMYACPELQVQLQNYAKQNPNLFPTVRTGASSEELSNWITVKTDKSKTKIMQIPKLGNRTPEVQYIKICAMCREFMAEYLVLNNVSADNLAEDHRDTVTSLFSRENNKNIEKEAIKNLLDKQSFTVYKDQEKPYQLVIRNWILCRMKCDYKFPNDNGCIPQDKTIVQKIYLKRNITSSTFNQKVIAEFEKYRTDIENLPVNEENKFLRKQLFDVVDSMIKATKPIKNVRTEFKKKQPNADWFEELASVYKIMNEIAGVNTADVPTPAPLANEIQDNKSVVENNATESSDVNPKTPRTRADHKKLSANEEALNKWPLTPEQKTLARIKNIADRARQNATKASENVEILKRNDRQSLQVAGGKETGASLPLDQNDSDTEQVQNGYLIIKGKVGRKNFEIKLKALPLNDTEEAFTKTLTQYKEYIADFVAIKQINLVENQGIVGQFARLLFVPGPNQDNKVELVSMSNKVTLEVNKSDRKDISKVIRTWILCNIKSTFEFASEYGTIPQDRTLKQDKFEERNVSAGFTETTQNQIEDIYSELENFKNANDESYTRVLDQLLRVTKAMTSSSDRINTVREEFLAGTNDDNTWQDDLATVYEIMNKIEGVEDTASASSETVQKTGIGSPERSTIVSLLDEFISDAVNDSFTEYLKIEDIKNYLRVATEHKTSVHEKIQSTFDSGSDVLNLFESNKNNDAIKSQFVRLNAEIKEATKKYEEARVKAEEKFYQDIDLFIEQVTEDIRVLESISRSTDTAIINDQVEAQQSNEYPNLFTEMRHIESI